MNLFDASALLAFAKGETGAAVVAEHLPDDAVCSAANWAEVAQKLSVNQAWPYFRSVLLSYGLRVEPVTEADAERAALLWSPGSGLSLADRLCLATGQRLQATVWTADSAWVGQSLVRHIRGPATTD